MQPISIWPRAFRCTAGFDFFSNHASLLGSRVSFSFLQEYREFFLGCIRNFGSKYYVYDAIPVPASPLCPLLINQKIDNRQGTHAQRNAPPSSCSYVLPLCPHPCYRRKRSHRLCARNPLHLMTTLVGREISMLAPSRRLRTAR